MKKYLLPGLTVVFIVIGFIIIAFQLKTKVGNDSATVSNNSQNQAATDTVVTDEAIVTDANSFTKNNLRFTYEFLGALIPQEVNVAKTQSQVASVTFSANLLTIIVEQKQFCNESENLQKQTGKYFLGKNSIVLANEIVKTAGYDKQCLAQLKYEISKIANDYLAEDSSFAISFQSESQLVDSTPICVYGAKTFNDGDYFVSKDGCNTCSCNDGKTTCSTDKVCETLSAPEK